MEKEVTLSHFIYTCPCGEKKVTDYSDKEISKVDSMIVRGIYKEARI